MKNTHRRMRSSPSPNTLATAHARARMPITSLATRVGRWACDVRRASRTVAIWTTTAIDAPQCGVTETATT